MSDPQNTPSEDSTILPSTDSASHSGPTQRPASSAYFSQTTMSSTAAPSFSATVPPLFNTPPEAVPPQPRMERRNLSVMLFVLIFLVGLMMIPWLSEQIVYSTKRGEERAKAEVAQNLLGNLPAVEQRIPWVAKVVAPSVVGIRTVAPTGRGGVGMDVGSGVIVDSSGYILTNYHVIAQAQFVMVRLNDGRVVESVQIVGQDKETDLAILKIDLPELSAIEWGDSTRMAVGDAVVAIGNPFDLGQTVTSGIISATERYNPLPGSGPRIQEFLQTDAAINPGNSGGPLVNLEGRLIGINTAIYSQTGGNLGIGFAIPSILAKRVYEEIRQNGEVRHGWLGIFMDPITPQYAEKMKLDKPAGVVVARFFPQSPAERAGLQVGDVILKWDGKEIKDPLNLSHIIVLSKPGTTVDVEIVREGKPITLQVTLGTKTVELNR